MSRVYVLYIDKDIIQVDNDKDIQLFGQDFIDITLEASWCIGKTKKYDLVLEMTVLDSKVRLLFLTFLDSYPMIDAGEILLGKLLCMS